MAGSTFQPDRRASCVAGSTGLLSVGTIPTMAYLNLAEYAAIPLAYLVHFWLGHGKPWEPTTFVLAAFGVVPLARPHVSAG